MRITKVHYDVLENMLASAERGDAAHVLELHAAYDVLCSEVDECPTQEDMNYDQCWQSCVESVRQPAMRKAYLDDARKKFEMVPKPFKSMPKL